MKPYPEIHQRGHFSIESKPPTDLTECDFGIQIAEDGRIWICINGMSFIRFRPIMKLKGEKND